MTDRWMRGVIAAVPGGRADRHMVVRFGGSLLSRSGWPEECRLLVAGLACPATLVVGGGAVVDGLRSLDAACPRPAGLMHRLAIDALGLTARLVADATGLAVSAEPASAAPGIVLDVPAWLSASMPGDPLPAGWHVTSDSIAAAVAASRGAVLLLAKSVPPPPDAGDLAGLARAGWVDGHFPVAARGLRRIEWAAPRDVSPTSSR